MKGARSALLAWLLVFPAAIRAEQVPMPVRRDPKTFTPREVKALADWYDVEPDSGFMQDVLSGKTMRSGNPGPKVRKVIVHIKGSSGERLPTAQELRAYYNQPVPMKADARRLGGSPIEAKPAGKPRKPMLMEQARTLPRCTGAARKAAALRLKPTGDKTVREDWLIVEPDRRLPEDIAAALGARVHVTRYRADDPDGMTLSASGMPLRCLPSRFRVTRDFVYQDEGEDALRNYDGDPAGSGALHPKMRELLGY